MQPDTRHGPRKRTATVERARSRWASAGLVALGVTGVVAAVLVPGAASDGGGGATVVDLGAVVAAVERGLLGIGLALSVVVAVGFVWVVVRGDAVPRDRPTMQLLRQVLGFVVAMYILVILLGVVLPRLLAQVGADTGAAAPLEDAAAAAAGGTAVWPVVLVLVAAAASLVALWRLRDRSAGDPHTADVAAHAVLVHAVQRLDAGEPVSDAVIAAYASLQDAFAAHGLPRAPTETATAYVDRVLRSRTADAAAVGELTAIYERVRFGAEPASDADRRSAAAALRRSLRALADA